MERLQTFLLRYFRQKFNTYVPAFEKIDPNTMQTTRLCQINFKSDVAHFHRKSEVGDDVHADLFLSGKEAEWELILEDFFSISPQTKAVLLRVEIEEAKRHRKLELEITTTGCGGREPIGTVLVTCTLGKIAFEWHENSILFPLGLKWAIHCGKNTADWALGRREEIKQAIMRHAEFKAVEDKGSVLTFHSWIHYRP